MFNLTTLNINGLHDPNKRMSLLQWLSHLSLDVVCLQETRTTSCAECVSWFSSYGFLVLSSPGTVHSSGVAILFRLTLDLVNSAFHSNGRFIMGHFNG